MTGVILSSKFIESPLKDQFGEILPIELPIQNKRLLDLQLDSIGKFCDEIYVTIPKGYHLTPAQTIKIIEIDPGLSLMEELNEIVRFFKLNQRVFINFGDGLFLNMGEIDPNENYFFFKEGKVGAWMISIHQLHEHLDGCLNFKDLLDKFIADDEIHAYSQFECLDFGNSPSYYHSRKLFLESRESNKLIIKDGFIIKSSKDQLKIWSEYKWLETAKVFMPLNVPFVTEFSMSDEEASYSVEYVNHPTLSDIFVFGKLSNAFFIQILVSIKKLILTMKEQKFNFEPATQTNFLVEKLSDRKNQIIEIVGTLQMDVDYIHQKIEENRGYFSNKKYNYSPMHGDMCFSNILLDFSTLEPQLIDPRGYTSKTVGFSMYGPDCYDYYKLAHSYVMGYDFLIAGREDDPCLKVEEISKRLHVFCEIFNIEKIDLQMGLINLFLSMLPLHNDSTQRQTSFINTIKKIEAL